MNESAKGSAVTCVACGQTKAPVGRSTPLGWHFCDSECDGYAYQPLPGSLWPDESRREFGFACSTADELAGTGPIYEAKP